MSSLANSSATNTTTMTTTSSTTTITEETTEGSGGDDNNERNKVLVSIFNVSAPTESGYIKKEISLQVGWRYDNQNGICV